MVERAISRSTWAQREPHVTGILDRVRAYLHGDENLDALDAARDEAKRASGRAWSEQADEIAVQVARAAGSLGWCVFDDFSADEVTAYVAECSAQTASDPAAEQRWQALRLRDYLLGHVPRIGGRPWDEVLADYSARESAYLGAVRLLRQWTGGLLSPERICQAASLGLPAAMELGYAYLRHEWSRPYGLSLRVELAVGADFLDTTEALGWALAEFERVRSSAPILYPDVESLLATCRECSEGSRVAIPASWVATTRRHADAQLENVPFACASALADLVLAAARINDRDPCLAGVLSSIQNSADALYWLAHAQVRGICWTTEQEGLRVRLAERLVAPHRVPA